MMNHLSGIKILAYILRFMGRRLRKGQPALPPELLTSAFWAERLTFAVFGLYACLTAVSLVCYVGISMVVSYGLFAYFDWCQPKPTLFDKVVEYLLVISFWITHLNAWIHLSFPALRPLTSFVFRIFLPTLLLPQFLHSKLISFEKKQGQAVSEGFLLIFALSIAYLIILLQIASRIISH